MDLDDIVLEDSFLSELLEEDSSSLFNINSIENQSDEFDFDVSDFEEILDEEYLENKEQIEEQTEVIAFDENGNLMFDSDEQENLPAVKRPLQIIETLERYLTIFSNLAIHAVDHDFNKSASMEIAKRLIEFYDSHNDILPDVMLSRSAGKGSLQSYVLQKIRNHETIKEIFENLKRYFMDNHIVQSNNNRFYLSAANESRVLTFLNQLKSFYDGDLAEYERISNAGNIVRYDFNKELNHLSTISSKFENNIIYPSQVFVDQATFVCGKCGQTVPYESFIKAVFLDTSKEDDFLSVFPSFEVCRACGSINTLPFNYFDSISSNLKENFKSEIDLSLLRERLCRLSDRFMVYPYHISNRAFYAATPPELVSYFKRDYSEAVEVKSFDETTLNLEDSVKQYKLLLNQYVSFNGVGSKEKEDSNKIITTDFDVKDFHVAEIYSAMSKIACYSFGIDYCLLKEKAIQSLLFFLDDLVPFTSNPYALLTSQAMQMIDLIKNETFQDLKYEFQQVMAGLESYQDYFSFLPIIHSANQYSHLEYYTFDVKMKSLIDRISDGMIIFNLYHDLKGTCVVGESPPFLCNKGTLKSVLLMNNFKSSLNKFNHSLHSVSTEHVTQLIYTTSHWLREKWLTIFEDNNIFSAFSRKDIYDIVKSVFSTDSEWGDLKKSLEPLREKVFSMNKLEFYYKDLFPDEDFSCYDFRDIQFFHLIKREEQENFHHYLDRIRKNEIPHQSENSIKHNDWFKDNISQFFFVLGNYLISKKEYSEVVFMDIMKYMTVYGVEVMAKAFGIGGVFMENTFSSVKPYYFPEMNERKELVKQILFSFPYVDPSLQVMLSECLDDPEVVIPLLLTEPEILEEEFRFSSAEVKELLKEQIGLSF